MSRCKIPSFDEDVVDKVAKISKIVFKTKVTTMRSEIDSIISNAFKKKKFKKVGITKFFR